MANIPDPAPAVKMRIALARARASGMSFADAWAEALPRVLAATPAADRSGWDEALRWGIGAWKCGYDRTSHVLSVDVADLDERRPRPVRAPDIVVTAKPRAA